MSEPKKRHHVFVVDDEELIASTLATILCHHGFDAKSFTDPLVALQAIQTEIPDMLISDVGMPRLSGIELAIQIRERCPECKVLLFSGQAATASLLDDARAKGNDFVLLLKPVHPTDLLKRIHGSFAFDDRSLHRVVGTSDAPALPRLPVAPRPIFLSALRTNDAELDE